MSRKFDKLLAYTEGFVFGFIAGLAIAYLIIIN